jgi:pyridoxal phosphate enzyme (YggS family)
LPGVKQQNIGEAIARVRERIANAATRSGRESTSVRLIAATKRVTPERVFEALDAGVEDIGENRVQEARAKREAITQPANWHLIGHLQSNKAKTAARLFDAVHSIDSERIARELARHRPEDAAPIAALIEVDLTGIPGRTGARPDESQDLLRRVAALPGVHVLGLMTIAPQVSPEEARRYFIQLRELRDGLENTTGWRLPELSMGMTDDFEVAIEEGATMVRIGRAIFGERA